MFNLLLFPPLSPSLQPPSVVSILVAREGFWSLASENTICSTVFSGCLGLWFGSLLAVREADRRIEWLLFMFLVKNMQRKCGEGKKQNKWYFQWPSKAIAPLRHGIKGQHLKCFFFCRVFMWCCLNQCTLLFFFSHVWWCASFWLQLWV